MTLGLRLVILILLAAVPVLLINFVHEQQLREIRRTRIFDNAQVLARLTAARQDSIVEGARALLTAASHLESVRTKNRELCDRDFREIAEQFPELTAMAMLSPAGDRWCISLTGTGPLNLADREYFQATIRTGTLQSSGYIVGRQTGQGSVVFTYPVRGPTGTIESVVFLAYRTSVLARMLNEPALPEGAIVALLDREGVVAARWPDPEKWIGQNLSSSEVVRQALSQRRGVIGGVTDWTEPGEYAFAFAPMRPPTNLIVLVALPLSAALREAEGIFWRELGWTMLVFLLAALFAAIGAHLLIVRPIRDLTTSVVALARGDFQSRPIKQVRGSREIRSLAGHFQDMAHSLATRQAALVEALQQKELLLKEVNHRVKNSLQVVASLLSLQRGQIIEPEVRVQFDEAARRIKTVAQVHQRLYQDDRIDHVSFDRFLHDLCDDLQGIMSGTNKVTLVCAASACDLPTDQVIPVALIANELITNAFKYAYSGDRVGEIHVSCRTEGNALVLSVSDQGLPLPENFDLATSSGLGMKMVRGLTKQVGATLKVLSHPTGKSFVVEVPLKESAL